MSKIAGVGMQHPANNLSLEKSLTTQGKESIFVDAVYAHLDGRRSFRSTPSTLMKLNQFIDTKFVNNISSNLVDVTKSGFPNNVRAPAQQRMFEVILPNSQKVTRTRAEVQLHILLQSQLRHLGAIAADTGDSISMEEAQKVLPGAPEPVVSPKRGGSVDSGGGVPSVSVPVALGVDREPAKPVSPGAVVVAMPPTQQPDARRFTPPSVSSEQNGSQILLFGSNTVDMSRIDHVLQSDSHEVMGISSQHNNCWWRAGWLSAIVQHADDPRKLDALLRTKLGSTHYDDIQHVTDMAEATHNNGVNAILTGMEAYQENGSRLKLRGKTDAQDGGAGELVLQRLTDALLAKAGIDESSRNAPVSGDAMGEVHHLAALAHELEADMVIFARGNTSDGRWSANDSSVEIHVQPTSFFNNMPDVHDKQWCTDALVAVLERKPVLVYENLHFNVCIPKARSKNVSASSATD